MCVHSFSHCTLALCRIHCHFILGELCSLLIFGIGLETALIFQVKVVACLFLFAILMGQKRIAKLAKIILFVVNVFLSKRPLYPYAATN